jgi:Rieske Fe-S protein
MTRYEFLKNMGFKGAALMALLTSCIHEEDTYVDALTLSASQSSGGSSTTTPPTTSSIPSNGVDPATIKSYLVKLDLNATATKALQTVGGYMIQSGVVIARVSASTVVAATQTCSHEPKKKVYYTQGVFYCSEHGARFSTAGKGLNSFGSKGLTIYKVATDGTTLVVYA